MQTTNTKVTVTGPKEDIAFFKESCLAHGHFDFNALVRMPVAMRDADAAISTVNVLSLGIVEAAAWSKAHWGSLTNAYDGETVVDEPDRCTFHFFAAGDPVELVFDALTKQFPALNFKIEGGCYDDEAFGHEENADNGRFIFENGNLTVHKITDLDAAIREALEPDMSEEEIRRLAEQCAVRKSLFGIADWLRKIERLREQATQVVVAET